MKTRKIKFLAFVLIIIGIISIDSCQKEKLNEILPLNETISSQSTSNFITEQQAKVIAENLLLGNENGILQHYSFKTSKGSNNSRSVSTVTSVPDTNNITAFYIVNYDAGGFVIISADDRLSPILAFSDSNKFPINAEAYPAGLVSWLYEVKKNVDDLRKNLVPGDSITKKEWQILLSPQSYEQKVLRNDPPGGGCQNEYESVEPLLSTIWEQGCGFNDNLPLSGCSTPCGRMYAGCVPIAMAQVMKFHEYPTYFNWNLMPDFGGSQETSSFIANIHSVVPVSYECDGTGVSTSYNIASCLINSYGYTSAYQANYNYSTAVDNLRYGRPVILSGGTDSGWWIFHNYTQGHMWVTDGFRRTKTCIGGGMAVTTLLLHMNWGWGGEANGWYAFNNFNPTVYGTQYTFNFQTKMVYNIIP